MPITNNNDRLPELPELFLYPTHSLQDEFGIMFSIDTEKNINSHVGFIQTQGPKGYTPVICHFWPEISIEKISVQECMVKRCKPIYWISFNNLIKENKRILNTLLKNIEKNNKIPFAFAVHETLHPDVEYCSRFDLKGQLLDELLPGDGFTCATFVLDVLRGFGYHALDTKTWKPRHSDTSYMKQYIKKRMPYGAHRQIQLAYIEHAVRYRPGEVVVGCHFLGMVLSGGASPYPNGISMEVAEKLDQKLFYKAASVH